MGGLLGLHQTLPLPSFGTINTYNVSAATGTKLVCRPRGRTCCNAVPLIITLLCVSLCDCIALRGWPPSPPPCVTHWLGRMIKMMSAYKFRGGNSIQLHGTSDCTICTVLIGMEEQEILCAIDHHTTLFVCSTPATSGPACHLFLSQYSLSLLVCLCRCHLLIGIAGSVETMT